MGISRRQLNRFVLFGGTSLASTTYRFFFPKPAEAYSLEFPLRELSSAAVFNRFQNLSAARALPGALSSILQGSSGGVAPGEAGTIRAADQVLRANRFVQDRTELAKVGGNVTGSLLWGRQRQDLEGPNVGFGFVQQFENAFTDAKLSGPTMAGIHNAQKVLAAQRLGPREISGSILPVRSTYDDLGGWTGENNSGVSFTQYRTTLGIATFRYDLKKPGRAGFGEVQITMEAEDQPTRNVLVVVRFT